MDIGIKNQFHGNVKPSSLEQATFEADLSANRITEVPSNMQMRADYGTSTDGQPDYTGWACKGLPESSTEWLLCKFTYDGNRQCTKKQCCYDSWDNHATTAVYE
jgi:hypothetical protein